MSASLVHVVEALAAADLHARARADAELASFLRRGKGPYVSRLLSAVRWQQDEDENTRVLWDVGRTHWFASITRVRPGCWSVMVQPREGLPEQLYVEPGGEHVARARALAWFEERGAPLVVLEEPCPT